MQDILVSIIVPVYNGEQFIERSITSVLNQTHSKIELIVVNDGSNDSTEDIVLEMKEKDTRIKYFKKINSGVSSARNFGMEIATGKYVGFVDADDYIDYKMIEILLKKAENFNCDIVSCLYEKKYNDKNVKEEVELEPGYYNRNALEEYVYPNYFNYSLPLNIVTKLFKKSIIKKYSLKFNEDLRFGEDLLFSREFLLHSNSFYFIDKLYLYKYVNNEDSATNKYYPNKWEESKKSIYEKIKMVEDYPEYKFERTYYLSILETVINSILNVFKNKNGDKNMKIKELSQIVNDTLVDDVLKNVSLRNLTTKKKVISYLVKNKRIKSLFLLLELYNTFIKMNL